MTRPSDWWVLDLEGDPTPGSPAAVRRMARTWSRVADDAAWAERRVRQLMGDEALGRWIGEAGDAFRSKTGDLPGQLGKCADSYGRASDALSWWAGRLETHQADADAALVRGRAAHADLEEAKRRAAAAAASVSHASGVPVLTDHSLSPTPEQVRDAQARLHSAQAARSSADSAVSAAQSRLDAARRLALDAKHLRESDGRTTADRIHEAADAGIPERSRWEKFKDWAGEAWHVVVQIAKVVVAVLGVIALIIGGPLAWVVFAAALILLADSIMKYMRGECALWEVALAAVGCIPGTKGLTTLAELRAAFELGGLAKAGGLVLSAARTQLAEMAAGVRSFLPGAGRRVYSLLDGGSWAVRFSREQVGVMDRAGNLASAMRSTDFSLGELQRLVNTPLADLSVDEIARLRTLREAVQVGPDTVLQKAISFENSQNYLSGHWDPESIQGFVSRADDAAHLQTNRQVYDGLRLDYGDTQFRPLDNSVRVVRFQVDDAAVTTAYGPGMGGTIHQPAPFTGNGFTGSPHVPIPEFHVQGSMRQGAEMWEYTDSSIERLVGVYDGNRWVGVG